MVNPKNVSCGLNFNAVPDLKDCVYVTNCARYEFLFLPMVHPQFKRELVCGKATNRKGPWARSAIILCSSDWHSLIVGKFSSHLKIDSKIPVVAKNSQKALLQEIGLIKHLGLVAVTFALQGNISKNINLARIIYNELSCIHFRTGIWIQVPLENPAQNADSFREDLNPEEMSYEDTWEWWNSFRIVCDYNKKLIVALVLGQTEPEDGIIERWLGEPVKCLILPTKIFFSNKKGFPVLSKSNQNIVKKFAQFDVQFVVTGANRHQHLMHYYHYIDYLWKSRSQQNDFESFAYGFEDFLQNPLQPLMDNLESETYEVFEKDPVKYAEYQNAVRIAMMDISSRENFAKGTTIVVMVVGAGRGPLVRAALNAAEIINQPIKVYAIEKNPNAVLTLQGLQKEIWGNNVQIVFSDMREWDAPEKADILVSELLGSFGDNELSPECLDGAQKFLKPDGISIPSQYSSYIAPIQSHKLYSEVKAIKSRDIYSHFEAPYVVLLQNKFMIDDPQRLFTFSHPNRDRVTDNSRYEKLTFVAKENAVLHGFSGYFDTMLYKNVMLSIEPRTHSPKMFSWFPIFFPLENPINVKKGEEIVVHFWRCLSTKNVWYEWSVEKPVLTAIHNPSGRSTTIGL